MAAARRQRPPPPNAGQVFRSKLMTKVARQRADLTSVVSVVLHEIRQHVDRSSRHPFHAGAAFANRGFKKTREVLSRSPQGALGVHARRTRAIERRWTGPRTAHARERSPDALHVRH